jgi:hypothetical protein
MEKPPAIDSVSEILATVVLAGIIPHLLHFGLNKVPGIITMKDNKEPLIITIIIIASR